MTPPPVTRRRALAGVTTVGLSLPLLSACGDDGAGPTARDTSAPAPNAETSTETSAGSGTGTGTPSSEPPTTGAAGPTGVVSTADVPVGSGVIIADDAVVVTQPTDGDIHVFTTTCTHSGCAVTGISDRITCPCHGSTFDLTTGDVLGGPASAPLPTVDFTLEGDQVVLS